jgi:hypothetical protein
MSNEPTRLEIRPGRGKIALMVLGSIAFVFVGAYLIDKGNTLLGWVAIIFFGANGLFLFPKMLRRRLSMVLSPAGLEWVTMVGSALIEWDTIEQIGVVKYFGQKMVGIRLRSYDSFLANMSDQLARFLRRSIVVLKFFNPARLASKTGMLPAKLWCALEGSTDPYTATKRLGQVGNLAGLLMWSRETYGYDVVFPWYEQDRSAEDLANLLDQWKQTYTTR